LRVQAGADWIRSFLKLNGISDTPRQGTELARDLHPTGTLRFARFGAQLPYVGEHRTSGERFLKQGVSTWLSSNRLQVRMMQAIKFEPKRWLSAAA
jgi:hypothetical protein